MGRNSALLCFFMVFSIHGLCQWKTVAKSGYFTAPELETMAAQQYSSFLAANTVLDSARDKDAEMVHKAGQRIFAAIKSYYAQKKRTQELKAFTWQINLVRKKDVNAYCLPGARLIIGTGMLEWAQNEGSLAVVIAHQMGHILASHGEERLNIALKEFIGSKKLSELLSSRPNDANDIFLAAYGAGNHVGLLTPFSLEHEMEADKMGMMFAGLAGYNPRETIVFWERMGRLIWSARQPVLMSAHRGDNARIERMQELVEDMLKKFYRPVKS